MEQVLYKLPNGWEWANLTDVCTPSRKTVVPKPEEQYNYIGLENIESHTGKVISNSTTRGSEISSTKVAFKKGMVLYGKLRPYLNKVVVAKADGIATTEVIPFECSDAINPEFLAYFFRSQYFVNLVLNNCSGARMPRATTKLFTKIAKVPILPIVDQKRIVEKLDALLTRIDTATELLQESVRLADVLYASTLNEMATGVDGKKIKLGELGKVIRGSSPRPKGDPRYYGGTVPRLMVADVTRDGRYVIPAIDFLTDEGALKSRPVPKGTLTIQVSGNPGTPAILDVDACIHDGFAALIEINHESISTEYLYFSLLAVAEKNNQMAVGAIFRNLTTSQLREIEIVIPSYEKQLEMVKKMDIAEEKVKALKAELSVQLVSIYQLKASILDSAFKGEL